MHGHQANNQKYNSDGISHNQETGLPVKTVLRDTSEQCIKCAIYCRRYPYLQENNWYGDSGTSCHRFNDDRNMYDNEIIN